jgi:hypothetical protein
MAFSRPYTAGCSTVLPSCVISAIGSRIGSFLLALGGAHAAPHILWLAGSSSDSHNGHLGAEAGHPLARCPLLPQL